MWKFHCEVIIINLYWFKYSRHDTSRQILLRFGGISPYQYAILDKKISAGSTAILYTVKFLAAFEENAYETLEQQEAEIEQLANEHLLTIDQTVETDKPYIFKVAGTHKGNDISLGYETMSIAHIKSQAQIATMRNIKEQIRYFDMEAGNFLQAYPEYQGQIFYIKSQIKPKTRTANCREIGIIRKQDSSYNDVTTAYITSCALHHGILMPYFEGYDLHNIMVFKADFTISSFSFMLTIAFYMVGQAIKIIQNNILHLDLATQNFILRADHSIQVVDFGHSEKAGQFTNVVCSKYDSWSPDRLTNTPEHHGRIIPAIPYHDLYSLITSIIKIMEITPLSIQNETVCAWQLLTLFNELLKSPTKVNLESFLRLQETIDHQRQALLVNDGYCNIMMPPKNFLSYRGMFSGCDNNSPSKYKVSDNKMIIL